MTYDDQRRQPLTATEIGVFLGLDAATVRGIVKAEGIASVGKRGRAKLYWTHEITDVVGAHDRRIVRKRRALMAH